jgi:DNA-binding PadR family transcriptional regulator
MAPFLPEARQLHRKIAPRPRAARRAAGPAHGYAIIEAIKRKSGQAFDLPEGTIYPALHRLEQAGLLSSSWTTAESGRKRRVYALTRPGHRAPYDAARQHWLLVRDLRR